MEDAWFSLVDAGREWPPCCLGDLATRTLELCQVHHGFVLFLVLDNDFASLDHCLHDRQAWVSKALVQLENLC